MLHYRAKPHFLVITQCPDVDHIVRADGERALFVIQPVGVTPASIDQGRFPRHTAIQGDNFSAPAALNPGVPVTPSEDVALLQLSPFIAGLPGIWFIMYQIKRRMIPCWFNLSIMLTHNMQRHLGEV